MAIFWDGSHRETQGKYHVMTQAEIGMRELQAKECQGLTAATRSQEGKNSF